ncbi:hypothetical protein HYDPIDRAFT_79187 [Hydnomerulius pinastri MD-312]|nr:hypothetical protein HYDPIDRAFT_79187 [Hydnomerulius pinastri MD-312]
MSVLEPTTSNTVPTHAQEPPFVKFPPFPKPPEGVVIMPFNGFKARGIQLFSEAKKGGDAGDDDEAELDALGIPTVELRVKHSTDECKSNTRKRRKKKKTAAQDGVPVKKLPWYEEWEEGEDLRVTKGKYDLSISPVDRFFQSALDFRTGRPWPPIASGLNILWDQYRMYVGLLINPSVFRKTQASKYGRDPSPDFDSDDEGEDPVMTTDGTTGGDFDPRPKKRHRSGDANDVADQAADADGEDGPFDPHTLDEELRDEKITVFLNDPEKAIRTFLSSYMREYGLIWSERNLIYAPRLLGFFLSFILRNRVLPEQTYQRGLKRALETIERAKKELPLTYKVGQMLPDGFNEACRECFGRKGGINWSFVNEIPAVPAEKTEEPRIDVTDTSTGAKMAFDLPSDAEMRLKDIIEDNVDMDVVLDPSLTTATAAVLEDGSGEEATGWGGGWGDTDGSTGLGNGWDQNTWNTQPAPDGDDAEGNVDGESANAEAQNNPNSTWADSNPTWNRDTSSLIALLGPSVFPLTHTTGIVECSTRRIAGVYPPAAPLKIVKPSSSRRPRRQEVAEEKEWAPSASHVEAELDARFAKVVLAPWGREEGDISLPEIWSSSRGPVVDPKSASQTMVEASSELSTVPNEGTSNAGATAKPHDPKKDSITLLVEPRLVETLELVPGLGLGAMWIEIARQEEGETEVDGAERAYSKKFWYHEDVTGIFPSFYTARDK